MRTALCGAVVVFALVGSACTPDPTTDGGRRDGGGTGGGSGGSMGDFSIVTLDPDAKEATYLAMAVDPVQERVGIAYYTPTGTERMVGTPDYALKYVEWKQGVTSSISTIRGAGTGMEGPVQRMAGLSVAFNPTSQEPSVAFLGGDSMFMPGMTIFWFQSDAVVATRSGSTWAQVTAASTGSETNCGNPTSDFNAIVVGLWPAISFDPTGRFFFAWRDGHNGQFEMQDWAASDVEVATAASSAGPFTFNCAKAGGNDKQAWGGRIRMAMGAGNQPAMVYDQATSGADTVGKSIFFQRRNADGSWTGPVLVHSIANVQSGGSIAYDATEGYGVAAIARETNQLQYRRSANGSAWDAPDQVYGAGSGGWYPSLAMDPINHEPSIAFYNCSPRASVNEGNCTEADDELVVSQRIAGNWQLKTVDTAGGYLPQLAFFASGKRVMSYRDPRTGVLKLAVER